MKRSVARRLTLGVSIAAAGAALTPAVASAAVTCTYTGGSGELEVDVTSGTPSVYLSRAANPATEVLVDTDEDPGGEAVCAGGTPTLANTSEISVDESGSTQGTTLFLMFANGRLEPGQGAETNPEIEITFTGDGSGDDTLSVQGPAETAAQSFRFGAVTGGSTGGNLNGDADDAADDITLEQIDSIAVSAGSGGDTITLDGSGDPAFTGPSPVELTAFGAAGDDTFVAGTSSGNGVTGGLDDDTFTGGPATDTFHMEQGDDTFDGAGGTGDFVSYENFPSAVGVTLDLGLTTPQDTGADTGTDQVTGAENVVGSNGPDRLTGTSGSNVIFGGNNSNDIGDDVLVGLGGADSLFARKGDDVLVGGQGNDLLDGEDGTDTASYALDSDGSINLDLDPALTNVGQATGGADNDTLDDGPAAGVDHEMENITGSPFAGDTLTGNAGPNTIDVHDGFTDTVNCLGGSDEAIADETGVDSLTLCEVQDFAPQTSIASGPADGATVGTATPAYDLTADEPSSFAVSVDEGPFTPCAASCSPPPLPDGLHTLAFHAVDLDEHENEDLTAVTRTVTIDTTAPGTTATGPARLTLKKKKRKTATASYALSTEAGATLECSLDGAAFTPCSSPHVVQLRKGSHTLSVRARDGVGNVDASPATVATKVVKKKRKKK